MILEEIKNQIKAAMKSKDSDKVALLRLIVGNMQQNGDESDAAVEAVIRKLIKNNNITIDALKEQEKDSSLIEQENEYLDSFLPKTLSVSEIQQFILDNNLDLTKVPSVGAAVGLVMKQCKQKGLTVQGSDVKSAVEEVLAN